MGDELDRVRIKAACIAAPSRHRYMPPESSTTSTAGGSPEARFEDSPADEDDEHAHGAILADPSAASLQETPTERNYEN